MPAPLDGLRVLELATGVAGPYAGRLLAMLGADVVKLEPDEGDPARRTPVDGTPVTDPSPLYVHLNAGKRNVRMSSVRLRDAVSWADAVIDDRVRREVAGTDREPSGAVWASVTAWGYDADDAGGIHDELLVQATSGVMTVTGDRDREPLRFPGWQSQYMAGAHAAAATLAALHEGRPHHLDVSWVGSIAVGVEGGFTRSLHTRQDLPPAGAHPLHVFPSGAIQCADGHVVPGTVRRHDWLAQTQLYRMPELSSDDRFKHRGARARNWRELLDTIQPWYDGNAKRDIYPRALDLGLALGMVVTPTDALDDAHMSQRGFLGDVDGVRLPVRPWITAGLPVGRQRVAARGEHDDDFRAQIT